VRRVLFLLAGQLVFAAAAVAMDFRVAGNQLILSGGLTGDELAKMRDLLPSNPQLDTVVLRDSPGGFTWTALRLAEMIADRGLRTAASGFCMSACVLIFLGGKERHFADGKEGNRTFLAMHTPVTSGFGGQSWPPAGTTLPAAQGEMLYWISRRLGPRADTSLLARAVENDHPQGFMYFFDYIRNKRPDGVSVFQCKGPEKRKIADCEQLPGKNALQAGLITSEQIVAVNP